MNYIIILVLSYLIGAIPSGVWLGKFLRNIDVRNYGSKNSGATNCYRVMGAKIGILVLLSDILKGFIPLAIAGRYINNFNYLIFIGLIVILAHTYSCFIEFKGGKGVATSVGVFLYLSPYSILVLIFIFLLVFLIFRYVSLASIVSAIMLPILVFFLDTRKNLYLFLISLIIGVFVVYRHKSNIYRLIEGNENKFTF